MKQAYSQSGFTLIEMIVSLGVFSGVITIAIGALLMLVAANDQLQGEQSVMTNLSFALDSMTREIRTGTDYYCDSSAQDNGNNNIFNPERNLDTVIESVSSGVTKDCQYGVSNSGHTLQGVAFKEAGDSITETDGERILYYFDRSQGKIFRRIGSQPAESIVSSSIYIHEAEFFVTGSTALSDDTNENDQASITIFIEASPTSTTPVAQRYRLQTTITQRTLDI